MNKLTVLIIGGRSDIGLALAHRFARMGHPIVLAARHADDLQDRLTDLSVRYGVAAQAREIDVLRPESFGAFLDGLPADTGIAISVVGLLPDQQAIERDPVAVQRTVDSNFTGPMLLLEMAAHRYAAARLPAAAVIGISSVAGDRGRARNYWYGAAKAAFSAGLSGLRQRHAQDGLLVMTVKPGFVSTRMTAGMQLPPALTDTPQQVAELVYQGYCKRRMVVYPWKWRLIMTIIQLIPERVFSRMKF